jgi:hypothetical protein
MPRLFPAEPQFPADGGAERAVWEALCDQLPDDVVLFSGLRLLDGSRECEIDLLVAWPGVGLAAIEVKGGHITRSDGVWFQGSGDARHRIDPVRQVQDARHTLTTLLIRRGVSAGHARTTHLVALPHTYVPGDWEIPEAPRDAIVDRAGLDSVANMVRRAIENHGAGHAQLAEADVEPMVDALCGGLPSQVEVLALAAEHEDRIDQMTRDQAGLLDHLRQFRRLRVVGGAGSGKTWMALVGQDPGPQDLIGGDLPSLRAPATGLGSAVRVHQAVPAGLEPVAADLPRDHRRRTVDAARDHPDRPPSLQPLRDLHPIRNRQHPAHQQPSAVTSTVATTL